MSRDFAGKGCGMEQILNLARQLGFSRFGAVEMSALEFRQEVRDMCVADRCLSYGKNWSCPPACGTPEVCAQRLGAYARGILVQTVGEMEDDFDAEAIGGTYLRHKAAFDALARQTRALHSDCLPLTAGACMVCKKCTCPDRPCRFPGKRLSSMEAYGLLVSDVCLKSGLEYNYGPKTITYTSCILFN